MGLQAGGVVVSLCGVEPVGPILVGVGSVMSIASDGIYITTDLIKGNYSLAFFRFFNTLLFNTLSGPLANFTQGKSKYIFKSVITAHETVVDEVSEQVENTR